MLSSRTLQAAFKLSTRQPIPFLTAARTTSPTALKPLSAHQIRPAATTTPTTPAEAHSLLVSQRLKRPVSPHLSIYQPQLTWYLSSLNRITGVAVSSSIYLFSIAYIIAPYIGWHLESASIAAAFGALPVAAKVLVKGAVAAPFTFHSWNGLRHLVWDTGRELHLKGVYRTGYVVLGLTAVSTAVLALM